MDGISPRRAFELRDLGHELLALALRGSILEGDEAGRVMVALATVSAFTSAVLAAMLSFMLSLMRCLTAAARWCRQQEKAIWSRGKRYSLEFAIMWYTCCALPVCTGWISF